MPTFTYIADGSKTVFNFPSSALAKTVRVNGVAVTPTGTTNTTATLSPAPASGATVEVFYGPLNGADPLTVPLALQQGYTPVITPVVRFWGPNADSVAFTLDMTAQVVDIYGTVRPIIATH